MNLHGLTAAVHTPFDGEGRLAISRVDRQIEHLISNRIEAVFVAGTTGECASMTVIERKALTQRWSELIPGTEMKLVVHVGSTCLADSKELASHAQACGAHAFSALAPYYFKPSTIETLVEHCAAIACSAPKLPFYFYDIPALTGVEYPMIEFVEMAVTRIPNFAGIKFTNPNLIDYEQCLSFRSGTLDLPWGIDEELIRALRIGARGAVGSSYNFAAPIYQRLIHAYEQGLQEEAEHLQMMSIHLIDLLKDFGYMASAKATMCMLGVDVGTPRLPNASLKSGAYEQLKTKLEQLGFFDWIKQDA